MKELEPFAADFNPDAWKTYTGEELYWWVHLLVKRATHRKPGEKRNKDLFDAGNYLLMLREAAKVHKNLLVQCEQLQRQLEEARGG